MVSLFFLYFHRKHRQHYLFFFVIFLSLFFIFVLLKILHAKSDSMVRVLPVAAAAVSIHRRQKLTLIWNRNHFELRSNNNETFASSNQLTTLVKNLTTTTAPLVVLLHQEKVSNNYSNKEELKRRFSYRRELLERGCATSLGRKPGDYISPSTFRHTKVLDSIYVNEERKILFCSVPKVASTTWRRFFVQLVTRQKELPFESEDALHDRKAMLPYLKPLSHGVSLDATRQMLLKVKNYTKIMCVRHPIRRLYSAWRSKFAVKNDFYWNGIGAHILRKLRPGNVSDALNKTEGPLISLLEFLEFVADPKIAVDDIHWKHMQSICLSCYIDYDYIGHLEGGSAEANFVIENGLGEHEFGFPEDATTDVSDSEKATAAIQAIPSDLLKDLGLKYSSDFKLFGYE